MCKTSHPAGAMQVKLLAQEIATTSVASHSYSWVDWSNVDKVP